MHRIYFLPVSLLLSAFAIYLAFGIAFSTPAQEPDTGTFVLQSQVPLVVLDVVVTDKKGHAVHNLEAADFTVLEKGEVMKIQSFEEHRADQPLPGLPPPPLPKFGPNTFTNITYSPNNGPMNVLLLDSMNTPMGDQMYVHQQMLNFLKKVPEGTSMAIFGLSTHLYLLQGFTTDPAVLKAVLNSKKGLPSSSVFADSLDFAESQANANEFMGDMGSNRMILRQQYTLDAMNDLARYLANFPGRKNIIWFAGSFPVGIVPNGDMANPFGQMTNFEDQIRSTDEMLTRSEVALYPVDARGLMTNPDLSASRRGSTSPQAIANSNANFFFLTSNEHISMNLMAEQTGGKAFYDTNGLKEAVQEAIDIGSNYYTLSYAPSNRKWNDTYRSIRVKLDQPDVNLAYRHGYYATDPNTPAKHGHMRVHPDAQAKQQSAAATPVELSAMERAMLRGGPDPTQIILAVQVVPSTAIDGKLSPRNQPDAKKMKPPYRHYTVYYAPNVKNLSFTGADNANHRGSVEFVTLLYTADGELVNSMSSTVSFNLPPAKYNELMEHGMQLFQKVDAPAKGEYFLRLGVHDLSTDHVGAVEVPLAALQPMPAAAAVSRK